MLKMSGFSQTLVKFPQSKAPCTANPSMNVQWQRGTNVAEHPMFSKRRFYDQFHCERGVRIMKTLVLFLALVGVAVLISTPAAGSKTLVGKKQKATVQFNDAVLLQG